jgi:hypothetical protein
MKVILKFNGGNPCFICSKCRVIVKENLSKEELDSYGHVYGELIRELPAIFDHKCLKKSKLS